MNEDFIGFEEYVGENTTIYLKSGFRFSGVLVSVKGNFIRFNDRFAGMKLINIDSIDNVEFWRAD